MNDEFNDCRSLGENSGQIIILMICYSQCLIASAFTALRTHADEIPSNNASISRFVQLSWISPDVPG